MYEAAAEFVMLFYECAALTLMYIYEAAAAFVMLFYECVALILMFIYLIGLYIYLVIC